MIAVEATIASEAPVDGVVLPMATGDFSRVAAGAVPLLANHRNDARERVGNVLGVAVDGGRLVANIEVTDAGIERQIRAGAKPNLSIGFDVNASRQANGLEVATDWTLLEVSLVGVGLDPNAGIGRAIEEASMKTRNAPTDTERQQPQPQPATAQQPQPQPALAPATAQPPIAAERQRVRSILEVGTNFGIPQDAIMLAVASGDTVQDFEGRVRGLADAGKGAAKTPAILPAGRVGDPDAFSLRRMYLALLDGERCGELERCREAQTVGGRNSGRSAYSIPPEIVRELHTRAADAAPRTRILTVGAAGEGKELVGTTHLAAEFVEPLRPQTWLARAGVRVLDGLMSDIEIPGQDGVATASWLAIEAPAADIASSDLDTETAVTLSPKEAGTMSSFSRKLLIQSSPGIEQLVIDDQRAVLDRTIEAAVISGTGAAGQPKGMSAFVAGDVAKHTAAANGTSPSWKTLVDLWAALSAAEIDPMRVAWLTGSKGAATLMRTLTSDGASQETKSRDLYLYDKMRQQGWQVLLTNLVPDDVTKGSATNGTTALYAADFGHCIVARWSGLDVTVDPYTLLGQRKVRVATYTDVDVGWRYGGTSMARIADLLQ